MVYAQAHIMKLIYYDIVHCRMHPVDFLSLEEWHRLLVTGCVVSEVAALKVEHLDGAGEYLHVVNGKGGKWRPSILPKPVLDAMGAHILGKDSGYYLRGQRSGPYLYQADPEAAGRRC